MGDPQAADAHAEIVGEVLEPELLGARAVADDEVPAATRTMAARLLSMDPLSLASTKRACAALANAMVPKEVTWSDPEMMLLAYRQGALRSRADNVATHDY